MGYEIQFADEIYDCSPAAGIGPQPTGFFMLLVSSGTLQWNTMEHYVRS